MSNNIYREYIIRNIIFDNSYQETELDDETRCHLCAERIKQIFKNDNLLMQSISDAIISVIYLDAYKVLNLKQKELSITCSEQNDFNTIKYLNDLEKLKDAVNSDKFLLEILLNYFLEFYRMDDFRKIVSFKALGGAFEYLFKVQFCVFENDIEDYSNSLNLDLIIEYAKKNMDMYRKLYSESQVYDNIIAQVSGFFSCLNRDDIFTFTDLFKEILELDYKWIKYITDKNYICDWLIDEELEYRIQLFEDNDMDTLIGEALCDSGYFEQLIDSFLSIKCDNMDMDEKVINEDVVNDHYDNLKRSIKRERD